jgi:hypothetical protein
MSSLPFSHYPALKGGKFCWIIIGKNCIIENIFQSDPSKCFSDVFGPTVAKTSTAQVPPTIVAIKVCATIAGSVRLEPEFIDEIATDHSSST